MLLPKLKLPSQSVQTYQLKQADTKYQRRGKTPSKEIYNMHKIYVILHSKSTKIINRKCIFENNGC